MSQEASTINWDYPQPSPPPLAGEGIKNSFPRVRGKVGMGANSNACLSDLFFHSHPLSTCRGYVGRADEVIR